MLSDPDIAAAPAAAKAWPDLDELLAELARLAETATDADSFYGKLLGRAVPMLAAVAGAVWRNEGGTLRLACQVGLDRIVFADGQVSAAWHSQLLDAAMQAEQGFWLPPQAGESQGTRLANPTHYMLLASRFESEQTPAGVLEIFERPDCPAESVSGAMRLLAALGELAGSFEQHEQLRSVRRQQELLARLQAFGLRIHRSLDPEIVADEIANEGRSIVGCQRLSVFTSSGDVRALSVSGVDTIDRRATAVQLLEELVQAVLKLGDPFVFPPPDASDGQLPPQISDRMQRYLDHAHVRSIGILPIIGSGQAVGGSPAILGALVAEAFTTDADDSAWLERLRAIAAPSSLALANAQRYAGIPLGWLLKFFQPQQPGASNKRWPKAAAVLAGCLVLAGLLAWMPADFRVEARGELQPRKQAEIFAPDDGVVNEVNVEHGSQASDGQVLAVLRKPDLDFEFSRIAGETQTARKRLAAVQASRLSSPLAEAERTQRGNQLTGEEEELKELIRNLEQQDALLRRQREQLTVRSPMRGQVLTWDVKPLLEARPVQRGQVLMTVADLEGPWIVELQIADDEAGHVIEARQRSRGPLPVSFMLATDSSATYQGSLERIGMRTELDSGDRPVVTAMVTVDKRQLAELRPGATVIARIDCGRRSLGYVWFHGLLEALRSRLWFY